MRDEQNLNDFNRALDALLGIENTPAVDPAALSPQAREALGAAQRLAAADPACDARPPLALAARWKQEAGRGYSQKLPARAGAPRWVWAGLAVALLALLVIFRQPVMAAVGRLFGYGYTPETGFVRLSGTRVLRQAVIQEHGGRTLTALRGLANSDSTEIWLAYSADARAGDDAWLELPDGTRLDVLGWEWTENKPGALGVHLTFAALPEDAQSSLLALPEGWRLPLEWVRAEESNLQAANVNAPYPTAAGTDVPAASATQPV